MQTADLREVTAQYFSVQGKFKNQKLPKPVRPLNTEAGRTGFTSCLLTPNTTQPVKATMTPRGRGPPAGSRVRLSKASCADGLPATGS